MTTSTIESLIGVLEDAAAQFERYERLHRDKRTPEGDEKAEANASLAAQCRSAVEEARGALADHSDSRQPPPHWTPEDRYDRHPKRAADWDWRNDAGLPERLDLAVRRLNFAGDLADPRAPDQMALVLRKDLIDLKHDWLRARALLGLRTELGWFSGRTNLELSYGYRDVEGDEGCWQVHAVNGGVNDREWTLVGEGPTPAEAIAAARAYFPDQATTEEPGLTPTEQKAQAARCGCKGSDDLCPCQNAPDRVTRAERAAK